jgi:hypothetical protein
MVTRLTCIGSYIRTYIAAVREEPSCYYQIPPLPNVTILPFSRHIVPLPSMSAVTTYTVDRWAITIHEIPRPEKSNPPPTSPSPVGFRSPISLFRPFFTLTITEDGPARRALGLRRKEGLDVTIS